LSVAGPLISISVFTLFGCMFVLSANKARADNLSRLFSGADNLDRDLGYLENVK
jgi:hypothetical protein